MRGKTAITALPTVSIGVGGDIPAWELVRHERTLAGWFFVGQAEEATFDVTLPPEELPGISGE